MNKTSTKIFKKGSLDFKEPLKINSIQTVNSATETSGSRSKLPAGAKAIVVEKHESFSIIEITCRCGEKLYLRCNHGNK
ncbi:MAG TPA: hypothetical protein PLP05_01275 [Sedimentisphaerales bacterium]|nr:hypothetical protein [Sedimentisphaerales bacterium]